MADGGEDLKSEKNNYPDFPNPRKTFIPIGTSIVAQFQGSCHEKAPLANTYIAQPDTVC